MELKTIKVADCFESPTNPRGDEFEGKQFDELVASITEKGVLMPILVRGKKGKYEVVAGNRRLRAAKKAGLAEMPARIVEMTDIEAREAQIVENLQRADVHPIDEAFAYRDLIENSKSRPEIAVVAAKVGKSESYVRQRLVLTQLDTKIAARVRGGELPVAHAVLLARLDKAEQPAAFKFATEGADICTLGELREHIANRVFKTAMKNPPWKNDEQAKAEIAKVTGLKGGEKNLFGEEAIEKIENPADYARALAAYLQLKIEEFKSAGKPLTLVSGDYSTTIKGVLGKNQYDTMDQAFYGKCKSGHDALIIDGDGVGKLIKICTDKKCPAHHHGVASETPEAKAKAKAERKKQRTAQERKQEKDTAAMTLAVKKLSWPLSEPHLDIMLDLALHAASHDTHRQVVKRRELTPLKKKQSWGGTTTDYDGAIRKAADGMHPKDNIGLLFELLVPSYSPQFNERRASTFKRL